MDNQKDQALEKSEDTAVKFPSLVAKGSITSDEKQIALDLLKEGMEDEGLLDESMQLESDFDIDGDGIPDDIDKMASEGDDLITKFKSFVDRLPKSLNDLIEIVPDSDYETESDSSVVEEVEMTSKVLRNQINDKIGSSMYSSDFDVDGDGIPDDIDEIAKEGDDVLKRMQTYLGKSMNIPGRQKPTAQRQFMAILMNDAQKKGIDQPIESEKLRAAAEKKADKMLASELKNHRLNKISIDLDYEVDCDLGDDAGYEYDGVNMQGLGKIPVYDVQKRKQLELEEAPEIDIDCDFGSDEDHDGISIQKPNLPASQHEVQPAILSGIQVADDPECDSIRVKKPDVGKILGRSDGKKGHPQNVDEPHVYSGDDLDDDGDDDYDDVKIKKPNLAGIGPYQSGKAAQKNQNLMDDPDLDYPDKDFGGDALSYDQITVGSIKGSLTGKELQKFAMGEAPREVYEKKALEMLKSQAMLVNCASAGDPVSIRKVGAEKKLARPGLSLEAQNHLVQRAENGNLQAIGNLEITKLVAGAHANVPEAIGMLHALADSSKLHEKVGKDDLLKRVFAGNPVTMGKFGKALVMLASNSQLKDAAADGDQEAQKDLSEAREIQKHLEDHQDILQEARKGDHAATAHLKEKKKEKEAQEKLLKDAAAKGDLHAVTVLGAKHARLCALAQSGNPHALEEAQKLEVVLKNGLRKPSGNIKSHKKKKARKKPLTQKLKRDKYGRLLDRHGKLQQKSKPFKKTITTKEALVYHKKIVEYGPLAITLAISVLMLLVALLITDKHKPQKSLSDKTLKVGERILKEVASKSQNFRESEKE